MGSNGSNKAFRRSEIGVVFCTSSLEGGGGGGGVSSCLLGGLLAVSSDTSKFLPLAVGNKLPFLFLAAHHLDTVNLHNKGK